MSAPVAMNVSAPVERVATVRPVAEAEASARVAQVYSDIRHTKQIDFVPRFWQVLGTQPELLEQTWSQVKSRMHPEACGQTSHLSAQTREIIAVAVSATNGCAYCVNSHTAALRKLGLTTEAIGEVMSIVALFNATNALAQGYQIVPDVLPPLD